MVKNLVLIVFLPVMLGVLINACYQQKLKQIKSLLPWVSVLSIIFIIGVIVSKNQSQLIDLGLLLLVAVMLHNLFGLMIGYMIPKLMHYEETVCKTISIEVGMQNSGLGVILASQHFSAVAALPGTLFSIWHNISGAILAAIWSQNRQTNDNNNT